MCGLVVSQFHHVELFFATPLCRSDVLAAHVDELASIVEFGCVTPSRLYLVETPELGESLRKQSASEWDVCVLEYSGSDPVGRLPESPDCREGERTLLFDNRCVGSSGSNCDWPFESFHVAKTAIPVVFEATRIQSEVFASGSVLLVRRGVCPGSLSSPSSGVR